MCLAIPSRIVFVDGSAATVDVRGARREVSLVLLPDEARIGDYVLVHAGFAIQRVDEEAAKVSLGYIEELLQTLSPEGGGGI